MTEFPSEQLVNVPSSVFLPGGCGVVVRLQSHIDIAKLRDAYGQRLHRVVIQEEQLRDVAWLGELSELRVEIIFGNGDGLSNDVLDALNRMRPLFRLDTPIGLLRNINLLASLGYPVTLNVFEGSHGMEPLTRALSYYLHNPLLNTPIEPFHSIMSHFLRNGSHTLWDIYREVPGRNVYVGEGGEVSLSQRWVSAGICFGTLNDNWKTLEDSKLHRRLVQIRDGVSESAPPCLSCPHRATCAGFLRAVSMVWPCEGWQNLLAEISNQARQVARLTELLSNKGDGSE